MKSLLKAYLRYLYCAVTRGYHQAMFRWLEKNPGAVLLDAGCWDGMNTAKYGLAVGTRKLLGLELVPSAAKKARERGVDAKIADLNRKTPLRSNSVDVIVCNHVIEHLYNVDSFVAELYRVLKPGGYLILGTPNLASWHNVFALLIGRQPFSGPTVRFDDRGIAAEMKKEKNTRLLTDVQGKDDGEHALGHIVVLTFPTLKKLLCAKGFLIERAVVFGYHPFPPFIAKLLAALDPSHGHYALIKARKK